MQNQEQILLIGDLVRRMIQEVGKTSYGIYKKEGGECTLQATFF